MTSTRCSLSQLTGPPTVPRGLPECPSRQVRIVESAHWPPDAIVCQPFVPRLCDE